MPITARLPITEPLLPRELVEKTAALARDLTVLLPEPLTNRHASARYRRQMIEVLLRRNLAALVEQIAWLQISTLPLPSIGGLIA